MTSVPLVLSKRSAQPLLYKQFVDRARKHVEKCGLNWDIPLNKDGSPRKGCDWDLRDLIANKSENGIYLNGFSTDSELTEKARHLNWSDYHLEQGQTLNEYAQDFIKALIVHRLLKNRSLRTTRDWSTLVKKLITVLHAWPWCISSADISRCLELNLSSKFIKALKRLVKVINENGLSHHTPIAVDISYGQNQRSFLEKLDERCSSSRLPEHDALFELFRIVTQEDPKTHNQILLFGLTRILYLSGLRLIEGRWLPVDCLMWSDHTDVVTGLPAGDIGGVSRSLKLKYYGAKRGGNDQSVLVEDYQEVPALFQELIAETVTWVKEHTAQIRYSLARLRLENKDVNSKSFRQFKTSTGEIVGLEDMLFLTVAHKKTLPKKLLHTHRFNLISESTVYNFVGLGSKRNKSAFEIFKRPESPSSFPKVKPHALRHLLNTELFQKNVSDTIITKQFGRTSVAQSYEYDHRTLAEHLENITLPDAAYKLLGRNTDAEKVAKLIAGDLIPESQISRDFIRIRNSLGEDEAFRYLIANADGLHLTPYGLCINSFAMNPCVKHLKCFDGCSKYAPSGLQQHKTNLVKLHGRLKTLHDKAVAMPSNSAGRKNQVSHAQQLLNGVEKAIHSQPNIPIFPDGKDFSLPIKDLFA
jgi:hypothetical protein